MVVDLSSSGNPVAAMAITHGSSFPGNYHSNRGILPAQVMAHDNLAFGGWPHGSSGDCGPLVATYLPMLMTTQCHHEPMVVI